MKGRILNKIKSLMQRLAKTDSGVALVITMLVMLTLVLISLSLVMQSNTEHLISQNEQDSLHALSDAEGVVDYANREIRTYIVTVRPTNLTAILDGSAGLNSANRAYMVGFKNNLNTSIGRGGLTDANEENTSGIALTSDIDGMLGFDPDDEWEVFRLGVDSDGDGLYDGNVRTVVYARLYDDYDSSASPPVLDSTDTDLRMKLEVRTIYPVYVDPDNSGAETKTLAKRGQSERHLTARFGPLGSVAIRSDSDMNIQGSLDVCGECGSAHANGTMTWNGPSACGSVTGTAGFEYGGGSIRGDSGTQPEIYIPIINPYDSLYIPSPTVFHVDSTDASLPTFLRCDGPSANDPGNSKYFAIIKVTNNRTQIYKAYRNYGDDATGSRPPTDTRWVWRLIGDSSLAAIDTIRLDNCGRVVTCGVPGCSADKYLSGGTVFTATQGVTTANNTFYGFRPDNNLNTTACPGSNTETIPNTPYTGTVDGGSSPQNDWNVNNFPQVPLANNPYDNPVNSDLTHSAYCGGVCTWTKALPGVLAVDTTAHTINDSGDGTGDFDTSTVITNGDFSTQGNDTYAPLYNAVIFFHARNVDYAGNLSSLRYYDTATSNGGATIAIDNDPLFDLNSTWRLTVITDGSASAGGTTNVNPPAGDPNYRWAIVAGRDVELRGNANTFDCNTTDCAGAPTGTQSNFAGAVLAHESVGFNGHIGMNGFVIAEDRATCSNMETSTDIHGSLQVHYDCLNPQDIWATESVHMQNWEESQRVQ